MQRRLCAIFAADMAGYSRLMEADEVGTIARQKAHRKELIDPAFRKFRGRIVKEMGDGILVEFSSVVAAVQCAAEIQRAMAAREAAIPEERRIAYRIGINLGDIVVDGADIRGDGVNVAARLEALAEPGGICISGTSYDQMRAIAGVGYEPLGEVKVKNIERPIRAYKVLAGVPPTGAREPAPHRDSSRRIWAAIGLVLVLAAGTGGWWWWRQADFAGAGLAGNGSQGSGKSAGVTQRDKPSIAVLPFENLSGDPDQEYFSDGMTADLITDLSKISALDVIAGATTITFKGNAANPRDIASELGVRYLVQGSVRRADGMVRISAQLVDGQSGKYVWADRYDRNHAEIFALQDDVLGRIIESLAVALTPDEKRRLGKSQTDKPEAYDLYLQGLEQESFFTRPGNSEAQRLFMRAIDIDPGFAAAYAHLAQSFSLAIENGWDGGDESLAGKAAEAALKATKLDPESPLAFWSLGRVYSRPYFGDPERAKIAFRRAVVLNPNYADGYMFLALMHIFTGEAEKAPELIEKAMRINPRYPFWYLQGLGNAQFFLGDYQASVTSFKSSIERNPSVPWLRHFLLASYGQLGLKEEAEWEISEIEALGQATTIGGIMKVTPIHDSGYRKLFEVALRKAGVPD